jgi:hypothetical protein
VDSGVSYRRESGDNATMRNVTVGWDCLGFNADTFLEIHGVFGRKMRSEVGITSAVAQAPEANTYSATQRPALTVQAAINDTHEATDNNVLDTFNFQIKAETLVNVSLATELSQQGKKKNPTDKS